MANPTNINTGLPTAGAPTNVNIPAGESREGTASLVPNGSVTNPAVGFASDADDTGTGLYRSAANQIRVAANGVDVLQFDANGIKVMGGGAVTQATSKSTGATLSKATGAITMNNAALAAGVIVSFTLTNTLIAATDVLVLNHLSGGTIGSYTLNAACGAGSAVIYVRNNTAGSLSEAIVISFVLIKGATS